MMPHSPLQNHMSVSSLRRNYESCVSERVSHRNFNVEIIECRVDEADRIASLADPWTHALGRWTLNVER
jgi:hypothetical protein